MKKKNIILISVIAAIVVATVLIWILRRDRIEGSGPHDSSYQVEDTAAVTKIVMIDKLDNKVALMRETSGWSVDGKYPASLPLVNNLLETLKKMRIRSEVNRSAVPNILKDIATHGVQVDVYMGEQLYETYFVGRETQDHLASFMIRKGDSIPCEVHIPGFRGYLTPVFAAEAIKWRSHTIVDLDVYNIARIELEIPNAPHESFAIVQDNKDFYMELLEGHRRINGFDTARVSQMLSTFKNLCFDEFASIVPNSNADSCVRGVPRCILRITDTDGNRNELKVYLRYINPADIAAMPDEKLREELDVNRLYALIDNKDTVLIQNWIFDHILQPASFFMGKNISLPIK
jgi:hypothetical protein